MILFFEIGTRTHKDHGPLDESVCRYCGELRFRVLSTVRYWVSLFFMPVIPYKKEIVSRCTHCSGEITIPREDIAEAYRRSHIFQSALNEDWDDNRLQRELNSFQNGPQT